MTETRSDLFTVTDLKQFAYCPRIFYYHVCLPDVRPITHKMESGISRHETEQKRSARRLMPLGEIEVIERRYDVPLISETLGLSGIVDELIITKQHCIPVDYKFAQKSGDHFRLQLAAYALMVEAELKMPVSMGLLYLIRTRKTENIPITRQLRQKVIETLKQMREIALLEHMPDATERRQQCPDCEFRRFCNDV